MKLYGRVNGVETEISTSGGGGADNVVEGYRNSTDGLFYEEDTYTTAITGAENTVYIDLPNDKTYRWNGTTFVRLDDVEPIQYSTMPTASAEYYGKIVQYIGTTTAQYTQGYFYKCVEDVPGSVYHWEYVDTSDLSAKEGKIKQTSDFTLAANGWDSNNRQTVSIYSTYLFPLANRNVVDISYNELQTWADCNVIIYAESGSEVSGVSYLGSITFQCDTVPDTALTFRVTSMEVS